MRKMNIKCVKLRRKCEYSEVLYKIRVNIVANMQNFRENVAKMAMCAQGGEMHKGGTPFIEI